MICGIWIRKRGDGEEHTVVGKEPYEQRFKERT
jgi:hypothetical protein